MSLSRRLTLAIFSVLFLFSINVGVGYWGSETRKEGLRDLKLAVAGQQAGGTLRQQVDNVHKSVLTIDALRTSDNESVKREELLAARQRVEALAPQLRDLQEYNSPYTQEALDKLNEAWPLLQGEWNAMLQEDATSPSSDDDLLRLKQRYERFLAILDHFGERQTFAAEQFTKGIYKSVLFTDRVTLASFLASIFVASFLGFLLVRFTNSALSRLREGTVRVGAGDLDYRIPVTGKDEISQLAVAFNDMARRLRLAMEDAHRATEEAHQANAAKSRFLANMSHELRTPLNAIIGYSEMMLEELEDTDALEPRQSARDLDNIRRSGRHLLALINDVLDISKIEAGRMELFNEHFEAPEVIAEALATIAPLAERNRNRVILQVEGELPTLHGDRTKFRQIITNLLSNACKFTDNGEITVFASPIASPTAQLKVTIQDSGIGMSEEELARVFDAFVQADASTSRKYGGTGLGLAICKQYCQLMGGDIIAESSPGKGSRFTLVLPITAPVSAPADA